jgi:hypothetical protein
MSAAQNSKVGFFSRPILTGTWKSGEMEFIFKAFRTNNNKNVRIEIYREKFPRNWHFSSIVMTYGQFVNNFIPILNEVGAALIIDGEHKAPGTWKTTSDISKYVADRAMNMEMKSITPKSSGGKSRRRGERSKKRARKTKHRRSKF